MHQSKKELELPKPAINESVKFFFPVSLTLISAMIAIATFFGCKPEKTKSMQWEYISKGTLINPTPSETGNVRIEYAGRFVKQLTFVQARLLNSGSLPIDSNDVKDSGFPALVFGNHVHLIGSEIKSRSPTNLFATIVSSSNSIQIIHGLLNPGDSIGVQILIDGEVGDLSTLPAVNARISGVSNVKTTYSSLKNPNSKKLINVLWLSVTLGLFLGLLIMVFLAYGSALAAVLWPRLKWRKMTNHAHSPSPFDRERLTRFLNRIIYETYDGPLRSNMLNVIECGAPADLRTADEFIDFYEERMEGVWARMGILKRLKTSRVAFRIAVMAPYFLLAITLLSRALILELNR